MQFLTIQNLVKTTTGANVTVAFFSTVEICSCLLLVAKTDLTMKAVFLSIVRYPRPNHYITLHLCMVQIWVSNDDFINTCTRTRGIQVELFNTMNVTL